MPMFLFFFLGGGGVNFKDFMEVLLECRIQLKNLIFFQSDTENRLFEH